MTGGMTRETIGGHRLVVSAMAVMVRSMTPIADAMATLPFTPSEHLREAWLRLPRVQRHAVHVRRVEELRRRVVGPTSASPDHWTGGAA